MILTTRYLYSLFSLFITISCGSNNITFAQESLSTEEEKDLKLNKNRVLPAKDQVDIWSLNTGLAFFPSNSENFVSEMPGLHFGLSYHYEMILFFSPKQTISFGLGFNHFRINHEGRFLSSSASNTWENGEHLLGFEKGNLRLNTLEIPLEYRFRFKKTFKMYFGYKMEYLIGHRDITFIDGEKHKLKNIQNIQRLIHGVNVRIGYKDLFLFGYFSFNSLINNTSSNDPQLFRFGLSIGG